MPNQNDPSSLHGPQCRGRAQRAFPAGLEVITGAQGKVSVTTSSATPAHDLTHGDELTLDCRLGSGDEVSLAATVF